MSTYQITIEVRVHDAEALYEAAFKHATVVDGHDATSATAFLTLDGTKVDEAACITMIFDPGMSPPGTKIIESVVEQISLFDAVAVP